MGDFFYGASTVFLRKQLINTLVILDALQILRGMRDTIKVAAETLHGEYYGEKFQPDTEENDSLEEKLDDLKSLFVIHLKGEYDLNLCHGVIFAIYSLDQDIRQHNRIRNRILRPIADGMLEACRNQSFK